MTRVGTEPTSASQFGASSVSDPKGDDRLDVSQAPGAERAQDHSSMPSDVLVSVEPDGLPDMWDGHVDEVQFEGCRRLRVAHRGKIRGSNLGYR